MITLVKKITNRWTRASIFLPHPVGLIVGSLRGGATEQPVCTWALQWPLLQEGESDELFPWQRTTRACRSESWTEGSPLEF